MNTPRVAIPKEGKGVVSFLALSAVACGYFVLMSIIMAASALVDNICKIITKTNNNESSKSDQ